MRGAEKASEKELSTGLVSYFERGEKYLVFWVNEKISSFSLDLGKAADVLEIRDMSLLVPEAEAGDGAPDRQRTRKAGPALVAVSGSADDGKIMHQALGEIRP